MVFIYMSQVAFTAKVIQIEDWKIIHLPKSASLHLPSRGMAMADITINNTTFHVALEPDGVGSHWFRLEKQMLDAAKLHVGDSVQILMEPSEEWSEPDVPEDLKQALESTPQAYSLWKKVTPIAHWDWIRWIRATKQPETRKRRIEVACSKLTAGSRRPCCFNRSACTIPEVSKNGVLVDAA